VLLFAGGDAQILNAPSLAAVARAAQRFT